MPTRYFIIESDKGGLWYYCSGTELDYKIVRIFTNMEKAIKHKNLKAWNGNT